MQPANLGEASELVLLAPMDGVLVALEDVPDPVFAGRASHTILRESKKSRRRH